MAVIRLTKEFSFEAAHALDGYDGPCREIHGHSYRLFVTVKGTPAEDASNPKCGMVLDFGDLKHALRELAACYDHALIYEEHSLHSTTVEALLAEGFHLIAVPFRPTAEEFAKHFYQKLQEQGMPVHRVTVYETPDNCASYEV